MENVRPSFLFFVSSFDAMRVANARHLHVRWRRSRVEGHVRRRRTILTRRWDEIHPTAWPNPRLATCSNSHDQGSESSTKHDRRIVLVQSSTSHDMSIQHERNVHIHRSVDSWKEIRVNDASSTVLPKRKAMQAPHRCNRCADVDVLDPKRCNSWKKQLCNRT